MSDTEEGVLRGPGGEFLPGSDMPGKAKKRSKAQLLSSRIRRMLEEEFQEGDLLPYRIATEIAKSKDESSQDRLKAVSFLADRLHGKSVQAVELSGPKGGPVKTVTKNTTPEKPQHALISEALRSLAVLDRHRQLHGLGGVEGVAGDAEPGAGGGPHRP
jgi:hypothetical protein